EPHQTQVVRDAGRALGSRQTPEPEPDVAFDRQPGKDAALLEDEDPARVGAAHLLAVDPDRARGRRKETGDDVQERGFPAPRRAQDADELALAHLEVEVLEHTDLAVLGLERHEEAADRELRSSGQRLARGNHAASSAAPA